MAKSMSHSEAHCCYVTMYFVVKTAEFPLHYNISTSVSPPKFGCTSHECHFQLLVSSTCSIWGTHELSAGTSAMASPAWADGNGRVKFSDLWRNMFGAFVQPSIYSIIFKTLRTLRYVFICFWPMPRGTLRLSPSGKRLNVMQMSRRRGSTFFFFPRKASNESSTPAERVQQKARAFPLGGV